MFGWQHFARFVIKPQIFVKLCLTTEITLFLQKMWKNDGNALKTWPLGTDRAYNCYFSQYTGDLKETVAWKRHSYFTKKLGDTMPEFGLFELLQMLPFLIKL